MSLLIRNAHQRRMGSSASKIFPLFGQYKLEATAIGFTTIEQKVGFVIMKMPGSAE